jgi:hypothetical protein
VKDVEPVVSGALGPAEHFCQSLEAQRAPVLRGKSGAQIAEDVAGRKRIARSGHKSVIEKFCFPSLLVHAFRFASKLAVAAFVQASIPLFAKSTWEYPLAQKERPAGWKSLPYPAIAWQQCTQARPVLPACGRTRGRSMASSPFAQRGQTDGAVRLFE